MPVTFTEPPDRVALPIPPFTEVGTISETSPVGVPDVEVTVTFAVTAVPCVMVTVDVPPFTVRVVVVAWKVPTASGHCVARLATLTEPRPVARSYPAVVVHAGVVTEAGATRTPLVLAALLLQFGEFPAHGTELLPFVTSLNAQVEPEGPSVEELQLCPDVAAILYKTGLALPCRPLAWLISAMMPANAGDEADVPPTPKKLKCPAESGAHEGELPALIASAWQIA